MGGGVGGDGKGGGKGGGGKPEPLELWPLWDLDLGVTPVEQLVARGATKDSKYNMYRLPVPQTVNQHDAMNVWVHNGVAGMRRAGAGQVPALRSRAVCAFCVHSRGRNESRFQPVTHRACAPVAWPPQNTCTSQRLGAPKTECRSRGSN